MRCKDCGKKIKKLINGERICDRCSIGYDLLYKEEETGLNSEAKIENVNDNKGGDYEN